MTNHHYEAGAINFLRLSIYLIREITPNKFFNRTVNEVIVTFSRNVRIAEMRRTAWGVRVRSANFFSNSILSLRNSISQINEVFNQRLQRVTFFGFLSQYPTASFAFFTTTLTIITFLIRNRAAFRLVLEQIFSNPAVQGLVTPDSVVSPIITNLLSNFWYVYEIILHILGST